MKSMKIIKNKSICILALFLAIHVTSMYAYQTTLGDYEFSAVTQGDGPYIRTNKSVSIYTESGHCKGTFFIYLHQGKKYIRFYNTWVCIQGKQRFAYNGNWYVIK